MKPMSFIAAAAITATAFALPVRAEGATAQDAGSLIEQADTNGDGNVSKAEFLARRSEAFADLDADGSGGLTQSEFELAVSERVKRFSGRAFGKVDADGNGAISQAEWDQSPARAFDKLDRNGDGVLTPDERERKK